MAGIDNSRWRVLAVTSENDFDKIKKHLDDYKIPFDVGIIPYTQMQKSRLMYTPMTLVIGTDGEVKKVWPGLWKRGFNLS